MSAANSLRVFVTGAGGFIGGSIAAGLARRGHDVVGLVRRPEQAALLQKFGIRPVVGSLEDHEVLAEQAKVNDAVVNAASAYHRGAAEALVQALDGSGTETRTESMHREDNQERPLQGSDRDASEPADQLAAVTVNASVEPRLKERRTCPLCGLLHTAFRCTVFVNVNARLRRIQKLKLCLLCLREGHQAATCPRKTTDSCKICNKGPHNRAVCMTANDRTRASSRRRSPVRTTGSSVDPQHPDQHRRVQKESVNWTDTKSVSTATNLRQSEAQSSSKSTPKTSRKKRSKKRGAATSRRNGTSRPPTNSTAESMKQKTADACGDGSFLPACQGLQPTDRCSKTNESTQFNQRVEPDGSKTAIYWESTDAEEQHELREAEEDSSSESSGGYSDSQTSTPEGPPDSTPLQSQVTEPWPSRHPRDEERQSYYPSDDDVSLPSSHGHCSDAEPSDWEGSSYVAYASVDEPKTLLECIKLTAESPFTGISRNVIVFFDSGSNRSFLSTALAHDLRLPLSEQRSVRVSTFGSGLPTTVEGFSTSIVLHSKHRRLPPLAFTACDSIVSSVRTALVEPSDIPKLRRGELTPSPIQVTPDILIGQDLVSHFKRRYRPSLPHGFYVVSTVLGSLLGGSGKVRTAPPYAAHHDFSPSVEKNEFMRRATSTSCRCDRHTLLDRTAGPRQLRKQPNPLDNSAPLPPPTIHVTLRKELHTDPEVQTSCNVLDRRSQSSVQQNPALAKPRKTQLRRRSRAFGRSVLGTKNRELRKCDNMRQLLDQTRSAISKHAYVVSDEPDTQTHYAEPTSSEALLPDVVCMAAETPKHDNGSEPTTGNCASQRPHSGQRLQSSSERPHSGQPNPATVDPCHERSHQPATKSQAVQGHASTNTTWEQTSRTPTGSNQHSTATTRRVTTHEQGRRRPCIASHDACTPATDRPRIPIIDGFVSKSFAAFLASGEMNASSAINEDLPPQYEFIGLINHLGVPSTYLPPDKFQPIVPGDRTPIALLTSAQVIQENNILPWNLILGSTLGALPSYWEMMTLDTYLHLHEEAQGDTYQGLPICGIGPTGFFLSTASDNGTREHEGQRQTVLRLGRIARNTGKCLVLVVYDEPTTGYDLHFEAIMALRAEARLPAEHPIHLVAYRASAFQLQEWLKSFPNVVFGVEHSQLTCLQQALQVSDHRSELYANAQELRTFLASVPLKNLALHSGGPSPFPRGHAGYFQSPTILLKAAETFEQLTGTPKDVLLEHSATNLCAIYNLNIDLPNAAATVCNSRDSSGGQHAISDLSARLRFTLGPARRADQADQTPCHSSANGTTHYAAPVTVSLPHATTKATSWMCAFCDDPHLSTECKNFGTVNQRLRRAGKRKLCLLCLRNGHKAAACPDRTMPPCQHCHRGQHHTALCRYWQQTLTTVEPAPLLAKAPVVVPNATHSVAREAGPTSRNTTAGTFPPAMNHFLINRPSEPMKTGTRVASRPAKNHSAAVTTPAQAPSTQPPRPSSKRATAKKTGNQHQVQIPSMAEDCRTDASKPSKTSSNQQSHSEKTEPSSDKKTRHRPKKQTRALAEAPSTPAVVPAEAHQQHTTAEYRQAPKRGNRKPKKRRH